MAGTEPEPRRRATASSDVPPAQPELSQEEGRVIVSMAYTEPSLETLRYETHRWSLRIWKEGEDLMAQQQVVFPTPVDPRAFLVRLENGLLEFVFAPDGSA